MNEDLKSNEVALSEIGSTYRYQDADYIVAGGYVPPSWASSSAKLILVNFEKRDFLHVHLRFNCPEARWDAHRTLIRRSF